MAIEITIPRLGWSMEEGTFVEWLRKEGETIAPGMPLFVLEGEKALQEIEATDAGILHIPPEGPQPGAVVPVGRVIAFLLADGETPPALPQPSRSSAPPVRPAATPPAEVPAKPPAARSPSAKGSVAAAPSVRRLARELGVDLATLPLTGSVSAHDVRRAARPKSCDSLPARNASPNLPRISPRAVRAARLHGVDWTRIAGSGSTGRIRERDILEALRSGTSDSSLEPLPAVPGRLLPVSPMRRSIAQRLQKSAADTVPVTLTTKINAANLVALRQRLKHDAPASVPSYNDLVVHRAASLLKEEPRLNACWRRDGIYLYDEANLAFAVDTDAGLVAPVIPHADSLSVVELAAKTKELSELARAGRLTATHLSGGTFTVTNLGMFGIDAFTPVLNGPQGGILGIGRIVDEPVIEGDRVIPGKTLTLSLTFDHRLLDGAPAARWLQRLAAALEQSP